MIVYSENESILFGYKMGRAAFAEGFADWAQLRESFHACNYDYVRVKFMNPQADLYERLDGLGVKYYHLDIIGQYRRRTFDIQLESLATEGITFESVNTDNSELLKEVILATYDMIPFGYYTHSELMKRFPLQLQRQNLFEYYFSNYTGNNPAHFSQLVFVHGALVGCVLIDWHQTFVHSPYVGVLKKYRQKGLLNDISLHIAHLTQQRGIEWGQGGARLHNLVTHLAMEHSKVKCFGYEWVFLFEKK